MKPTRFLTAGFITLMLSVSANAQLTWDTSTDPGIQIATGTWDTTTSNWTSDGGTTNTTWTNGSAAVFAGDGAANVDLSGAISVNNLSRTDIGNLRIRSAAGNTLAISGDVDIATGSYVTLQAAGNNEFTGSFTKTGGGLLEINGTNTQFAFGTVTLSAGTIGFFNGSGLESETLVLNGGAIGSLNTFTRAMNGAVSIGGNVGIGAGTGTSLSTGTMNFGSAGSIDLAGGTRTLTIGSDVNFNGVVSNGGIIKEGAGRLTISNIGNTFTDDTVVNAGELRVLSASDQTGLLGTLGSGSVTVNSGAALRFSTGSTSNAKSYANDININNATLAASDGTHTLTGNLALTGANTIEVQWGGKNLILTGAVTGSSSITKTGAGGLIFGNGGATGSLAAGIDVAINAGIVAFNRSDAITLNNNISGAGSLHQIGSGTTTLTGNNTYSGVTNVTGGTLRIADNDNRLPVASSANLANTAGVTLDLNGFSQELRGLSGGGTTGGLVTNAGAGLSVLTLRPSATDTPTFSGVIEGNVRLEIVGSKTSPDFIAPRQRLAGTANTFTGGILIDGGTLLARLDGSLGAVPVAFDAANITLRNNGTLFNEANDNALAIHANRGITLGTGGGALSAGFNQNGTIHGQISGASGNDLTILANNGTMFFTGVNTYAGETIIQGTTTSGLGRLSIGDGGTSGTLGSGNVVNNGSLTFNRSDATTVDNNISGDGSVRNIASGTTTFTGDNTYGGSTLLQGGGTLEVTTIADAGGAGSLGTLSTPDNSWLGVRENSTLRITGTGTQTTSRLVWNDAGTGSGTFDVVDAGASVVFTTTGGTINRELIKTGAGAMTLTRQITTSTGAVTVNGGSLTLLGANTYSGATIVNAGTLAINNSLGSDSTVSVADGATLINNGTIAGAVTTLGSTSVLTGTGTFSGAATVGGQLNPGNSPGYQAFTSTLTLGSTALTTFELGGITRSDLSANGINHYDAIDVTGLLTLDGLISIIWFGGYEATNGTTFNLLNWGSIDSSGFNLGTDLALPTFTDTSLSWDTSSFLSAGSIAVIPEPKAALLGGLGLLALLRRRRAGV